MSYQLTAVTEDLNTTIVGCVFPPLVEGANYKLTGLSQGTLGAYTVYAKAISTTELDCFVTILADGETTTQTYEGWMNWDTCSLEEVHDIRHNLIRGIDNISNFKWFSTNTHSNFVDKSAIFLPALTANNIQLVQGNQILGNSVVNLSGQTGTINFISNQIFESAIILSTTGTKVIVDNIFNGTDINLSNANNNTINYNVFLSGNLVNTATKTVTILNSVSVNSSLNLSGAAPTLTINGLQASNSTLNFTSGSITNLVVETGTFNNNGFNAINSKLQNETTTLVAAVTNATKSGYVNILP